MATGERIESGLRDFFHANPHGALAVYLYGSRARDENRESSDVDVAILLREPPPRTLGHPAIRLAGELEDHLGLPVDVVVLNDAPPDLVHRILRDGRILIDRDPAARIRFEIRARNEFFDLQPVLHRYRKRSGAPS
jgi:predicted nucleotidyltransferase